MNNGKVSRMPQFKEFVSRHPSIRDEVVKGKKTWQNIYEDWVILGEESDIWKPYRVQDEKNNSDKIDLLSSENFKNIMGYIKKINPDSISKTLNTVQKILQITGGLTNKPTGIYNANYNSWWD
jgi:hypothetical protein